MAERAAVVDAKPQAVEASRPPKTSARTCECGRHVTPGGGLCKECRDRHESLLWRSALDDEAPRIAPPLVHRVLREGGEPLDGASRAAAERRFGRDFAGVRLHRGADAAASARAVHALGYAAGSHVVLGAGIELGAAAGMQLLMHELTHVVQQATATPVEPLTVAPSDSSEEQEARGVAAGVAHEPSMMRAGPAAVQVARAPDDLPPPTANPTNEPIILITIDLGSGTAGLHSALGLQYRGKVTTDLEDGVYEMTPRPRQQRWNIIGVGGGRRFDIDLEGPSPWTLPYSPGVRLEVQQGTTANASHDLPPDERMRRITELVSATWVGSSEEEELIRLLEETPEDQAAEMVRRLGERRFDGDSYFDKLDSVVDLGNNLRLHEALSKLRIKAMGVEKGAESLLTAPVLPWHDVMGFFEDSATFSVERTESGKIRIRYLGGSRLFGSTQFGGEVKRLPFDLLIGGKEFDPDQVLIIHDYDSGKFVPVVAQQLIGYQRAGIRKFLSDVGTVASFAVPVSAAESVAGKVAVATFERILPAALLIIDENRLNIVKWFPRWGPKMLRYADIVKLGVAAYGIGRFAVSGWQIFTAWREVRASRAALEGATLDAKAEAAALQMEQQADRLISEAEKIHEAQAAKSTLPPSAPEGAGTTPPPTTTGPPPSSAVTGPGAPAPQASLKAPPKPSAADPAKPTAAEDVAGIARDVPEGAAATAATETAPLQGITKETEDMLSKNPPLREALEANPRAAAALKLCKSLCIPKFATAKQVEALEAALAKAEAGGLKLNRAALREYLHKAKNNFDLESRLQNVAQEVENRLSVRSQVLSDIAETSGPGTTATSAAKEGLDIREAGKVAPPLSATEPSVILGKNLGSPPASGMHAHHIVPTAEGGEGMQWLRDALGRAHVGQNEAENGVWLLGAKQAENVAGTVPHTTYLHAGNRTDYLFTISSRLQGKEGPELLSELADIKRELGSGTFQFRAAPSRWKPGDPIR